MADTAAQAPLHGVFEATYGRTPTVAARRLQWARDVHEQALLEGDSLRATALAEQIDALEHVLAKHVRCRMCGRALKKPISVARGIGPECWGKAS